MAHPMPPLSPRPPDEYQMRAERPGFPLRQQAADTYAQYEERCGRQRLVRPIVVDGGSSLSLLFASSINFRDTEATITNPKTSSTAFRYPVRCGETLFPKIAAYLQISGSAVGNVSYSWSITTLHELLDDDGNTLISASRTASAVYTSDRSVWPWVESWDVPNNALVISDENAELFDGWASGRLSATWSWTSSGLTSPVATIQVDSMWIAPRFTSTGTNSPFLAPRDWPLL